MKKVSLSGVASTGEFNSAVYILYSHLCKKCIYI